MKYFVKSFVVLLLISIPGYAQHKRVPKNIKQAIHFLDMDCPDSVKSIIKETANKDLKDSLYPWKGNYQTIYDWLNGDNKDLKLLKYLSGKGIHSNEETIILIAFKEYLLGKELNEPAIYAPWLALEKKNAKEDSVRYTTDSLRGIYIPVNLEDCFKQIDAFWNDSIKIMVKQMTEGDFAARAHRGFGMWMRNNWQLWGGSRLSRYFNDNGIYQPEEMSGIILVSYHRHLNNEDIKFDERIKSSQKYWKDAEARNLAIKEEKFAAYKIGDTLTCRYRYGYVSKKQKAKEFDDICIAQCQVLEKNKDNYTLKVRLLESCDPRGIIIYDSNKQREYDSVTKKFVKPKKRIRKHIKIGQSYWSDYDDWIAN